MSSPFGIAFDFASALFLITSSSADPPPLRKSEEGYKILLHPFVKRRKPLTFKGSRLHRFRNSAILRLWACHTPDSSRGSSGVDEMHWKFPSNFTGSSQEQNQTQNIPTQSWYPPSVVGSSPSSSHPSTPGSSSSISAYKGSSDNVQSSSKGQPSPTEASGIISRLKDKTVDELRKLLTDKDAYNSFFLSLEPVKVQNNLRDELQKETLQLARENLDKEPRILELRNQCQIIRTSELAAAQETLSELEKQKEELLKSYSPPLLLQKLQDAINKVEEESEVLHRQLLENQIDLSAFVQRYKKLRTIYHRRALIHLAAKTSV